MLEKSKGRQDAGSVSNGMTRVGGNIVANTKGKCTFSVGKLYRGIEVIEAGACLESKWNVAYHSFFRIPLAGSFIRQTTATSFGVSFRRALEDKYLNSANAFQGNTKSNVEVYLLGSSSGIEIEAPNFDRVRKKFSQIERLKELSLDGEGVSSIEADDELRKWCRSERNFACFLLP